MEEPHRGLLDLIVYRLTLSIVGAILLIILLRFVLPPATTPWSWDFGAGLINLVATLIGVFLAFYLERWIERRRAAVAAVDAEATNKERYAQELDGASTIWRAWGRRAEGFASKPIHRR